jgi:hypothetical protein
VPVAKASDLCILLVEVARCFPSAGRRALLGGSPDHGRRGLAVTWCAVYDFATTRLSNTCFVWPSATNCPHIASSDRADGYAHSCFDFASGLQVPGRKAAPHSALVRVGGLFRRTAGRRACSMPAVDFPSPSDGGESGVRRFVFRRVGTGRAPTAWRNTISTVQALFKGLELSIGRV